MRKAGYVAMAAAVVWCTVTLIGWSTGDIHTPAIGLAVGVAIFVLGLLATSYRRGQSTSA